MRIFFYDQTFEGLLTAVFDAYKYQAFPDLLLHEGDIPPLFHDETYTVCTDSGKANRVWAALARKQSTMALTRLTMCWLSEQPETDMLLFRYIRKSIDAPSSIELDFADEDVLTMSRLWKKVTDERTRVIEFLRFQKTADNIFFGAIKPRYDVLPLTTDHFGNRFRDQSWLIYDLKRNYGFYYDRQKTTEVCMDRHIETLARKMPEELMAEGEAIFQQMWKAYFQATTIRERLNPKLHRRQMPVRFWQYLTEKK